MMIEILSKDKDELMRLVSDNCLGELRCFLDKLCVVRNGSYAYCATRKKVAALILSSASVNASIGRLSDEMAYMLVDRLSVYCELFDFAKIIMVATADKTPAIMHPGTLTDIYERLRYNYFTEDVAKYISMLGANETLAVIRHIATSSDMKVLNVGFNAPIIRNLYQHRVVKRELVLAYIATSLRELPSTVPGIIITAL